MFRIVIAQVQHNPTKPGTDCFFVSLQGRPSQGLHGVEIRDLRVCQNDHRVTRVFGKMARCQCT